MPSIAYEFDQQPPIQGGVKAVGGTPEGVLKAPPGYRVINRITGKMYLKESDASLSTGWKIVTTT